MITKSEKIWFLRGILVALAVTGHEMTYDQIRRIMRLSDRQVGAYLGEARQIIRKEEPDICASVTKKMGAPGLGWGNLDQWAQELKRLRDYWRDRSENDNTDFLKIYTYLPSLPGELDKNSG